MHFSGWPAGSPMGLHRSPCRRRTGRGARGARCGRGREGGGMVKRRRRGGRGCLSTSLPPYPSLFHRLVSRSATLPVPIPQNAFYSVEYRACVLSSGGPGAENEFHRILCILWNFSVVGSRVVLGCRGRGVVGARVLVCHPTRPDSTECLVFCGIRVGRQQSQVAALRWCPFRWFRLQPAPRYASLTTPGRRRGGDGGWGAEGREGVGRRDWGAREAFRLDVFLLIQSGRF